MLLHSKTKVLAEAEIHVAIIHPSTFAEQTSMRPAKCKSWQQTRASLKGPGWGWKVHGSGNHKEWLGAQLPHPDDTAAGSSREPGEEGQYSLLGVRRGPWGNVVWIRRWCLDHAGKEALAFRDPASLISMDPSWGLKDRPLRGFSDAGTIRPGSLGSAPWVCLGKCPAVWFLQMRKGVPG